MTEIDWDEAARQWDRLVKEQSSKQPERRKMPMSSVYTVVCLLSCFAWLIRSLVLGDLWLIGFALSTFVFFVLTGRSKDTPSNERTSNPNP